MEARQIKVAWVQGGEKEAKGLGREVLEEERGKVQLSEKEKETRHIREVKLDIKTDYFSILREAEKISKKRKLVEKIKEKQKSDTLKLSEKVVKELIDKIVQ